jgi:hypothetical protein
MSYTERRGSAPRISAAATAATESILDFIGFRRLPNPTGLLEIAFIVPVAQTRRVWDIDEQHCDPLRSMAVTNATP